MNLMDQLRAYRTSHGLAYEAMASKLGLHKSQLKRWEEGATATLQAKSLRKLANAGFDVTGAPRFQGNFANSAPAATSPVRRGAVRRALTLRQINKLLVARGDKPLAPGAFRHSKPAPENIPVDITRRQISKIKRHLTVHGIAVLRRLQKDPRRAEFVNPTHVRLTGGRVHAGRRLALHRARATETTASIPSNGATPADVTQ